MKILVLLLGHAVGLFAQDGPGWKTDPQHRQLKYRVQCSQGSATVDWRNGYPSEVNIRANLRSAVYQGPKELRIAPGGSAQSRLETMDCAPLRVAITRFSVAGAPAPVAARQFKPAVAKAQSRPAKRRAKRRRRPKVVAPVKAAKKVEPAVPQEAVGSARVGMTTDQVMTKLGAPAAKVTIPEEGHMVQIFSYRTGAVYFTNGKVTEVRPAH